MPLHELVDDIWTQITLHLDYKDITTLKCTNPIWKRRFEERQIVKEFWSFENKSNLHLLPRVARFDALLRLYIKADAGYESLSHRQGRWLQHLPKTLETLEFDFDSCLVIWLVPDPAHSIHWLLKSGCEADYGFAPIDVANLLPNLASLRLKGSWASFCDVGDWSSELVGVQLIWSYIMIAYFIRQLPRGLRELHIPIEAEELFAFLPPHMSSLTVPASTQEQEIQLEPSLCASLTSLYADLPEKSYKTIIPLLSHLTTLSLFCSPSSIDLKHLPTTLTDLTLQEATWSVDGLIQLPRLLTRLKIIGFAIDCDDDNPQDLLCLPIGLTSLCLELEVNHFDFDFFEPLGSYPPNLEQLHLRAAYGNPAGSVVFNSFHWVPTHRLWSFSADAHFNLDHIDSVFATWPSNSRSNISVELRIPEGDWRAKAVNGELVVCVPQLDTLTVNSYECGYEQYWMKNKSLTALTARVMKPFRNKTKPIAAENSPIRLRSLNVTYGLSFEWFELDVCSTLTSLECGALALETVETTKLLAKLVHLTRLALEAGEDLWQNPLDECTLALCTSIPASVTSLTFDILGSAFFESIDGCGPPCSRLNSLTSLHITKSYQKFSPSMDQLRALPPSVTCLEISFVCVPNRKAHYAAFPRDLLSSHDDLTVLRTCIPNLTRLVRPKDDYHHKHSIICCFPVCEYDSPDADATFSDALRALPPTLQEISLDHLRCGSEILLPSTLTCLHLENSKTASNWHHLLTLRLPPTLTALHLDLAQRAPKDAPAWSLFKRLPPALRTLSILGWHGVQKGDLLALHHIPLETLSLPAAPMHNALVKEIPPTLTRLGCHTIDVDQVPLLPPKLTKLASRFTFESDTQRALAHSEILWNLKLPLRAMLLGHQVFLYCSQDAVSPTMCLRLCSGIENWIQNREALKH